jgi:hypothetical protein
LEGCLLKISVAAALVISLHAFAAAAELIGPITLDALPDAVMLWTGIEPQLALMKRFANPADAHSDEIDERIYSKDPILRLACADAAVWVLVVGLDRDSVIGPTHPASPSAHIRN